MPLLSYRIDDGGHHQVWVQLEEGDPLTQHEAFILGSGPTLEQAKADAVRDLMGLLDQLHGPPLPAGVVDHGRD